MLTTAPVLAARASQEDDVEPELDELLALLQRVRFGRLAAEGRLVEVEQKVRRIAEAAHLFDGARVGGISVC